MDASAPELEFQEYRRNISESWSFNGETIVRHSVAGSFSSISELPEYNSSFATAKEEGLREEWDKFTSRNLGCLRYEAPSGSAGFVDLFSGCGGLSLGISHAASALGIRPYHRFAADIDEVALSVYRTNFPSSDTINRSIPELIDYKFGKRGSRLDFSYPPEILHDGLCTWKDRITAVIGGPPCQGHSNFNNISRRSDPRNSLYLTLPAIAVALNAPLVIIENVPDVINDKSGVVTQAKRLLESEGFMVDEKVISAVELGLPQTRRRHILVASKCSQPDLNSAMTALSRPTRGVEWIIGDLQLSNDTDDIFNQAATLSMDNQARINYLFDNDQYELSDHMRPDCHKDGHTYPSVYGRLHRDQPSGTITTGFLSPGRGRYTHPSERRGITPHEAARLQGFPDTFVFGRDNGKPMIRKSLSKLIGDAVPPVIGYLAGFAAFATLTKSDLKY